MNPTFILEQWTKLNKIPFGKKIFSKILGGFVPYSGSIKAEVDTLHPGEALLYMNDRRSVRNHLSSIHAIALVNLAELTSGLALLSSLPANSRAILVGFQIEYLKKARGRIHAHCKLEKTYSEISESIDVEVPVEILNEAKDVLCRAKARWKVSPVSKEKRPS